ncbi:unnamed protein product [Rhizophagus irregularis]|nr:unnamed protein product [Rhizophagus irregularis]
MDISNQNLNTTEITIRNNSKTDSENLWKDDDNEYQFHATIFSTDSTTESDETTSIRKRVKLNIMDLEKRKKAYGVCGECNEPGNIVCWGIERQEWFRSSRKVALKSLNNSSNNISNDFLNEIKYYISDLIIKCWDAKAENRPTAKELRQTILKYGAGMDDENSEISRLLNFENLPEPVNSTDYSSSYQETISSSSANPISECLDCELNELDLNQDDDE